MNAKILTTNFSTFYYFSCDGLPNISLITWFLKLFSHMTISLQFSENFTIVLFHYDGRVSEWDEFEWSKRAIHVSAMKQTKWWAEKVTMSIWLFIYLFLQSWLYVYLLGGMRSVFCILTLWHHMNIYSFGMRTWVSRILMLKSKSINAFIWHKLLENCYIDCRTIDYHFISRYIKLVKKHNLEISQPGLEQNHYITWEMTKKKNGHEIHKWVWCLIHFSKMWTDEFCRIFGLITWSNYV